MFDLDGVLVDTYEVWYRLVRDAGKQFGYKPISRAKFHHTWGQSVNDDVKYLFPKHTVEEVSTFYENNFGEYCRNIRVDASARAAFKTLRARGIKLAVITNSPRRIGIAALRAARLKPQVLVTCSDVARSKPAPDMVLKACRILKVKLAHALVIGDSRFDKMAAKAAGTRFVRYEFGGNLLKLERYFF